MSTKQQQPTRISIADELAKLAKLKEQGDDITNRCHLCGISTALKKDNNNNKILNHLRKQ
jgi:hypothetical protein